MHKPSWDSNQVLPAVRLGLQPLYHHAQLKVYYFDVLLLHNKIIVISFTLGLIQQLDVNGGPEPGFCPEPRVGPEPRFCPEPRVSPEPRVGPGETLKVRARFVDLVPGLGFKPLQVLGPHSLRDVPLLALLEGSWQCLLNLHPPGAVWPPCQVKQKGSGLFLPDLEETFLGRPLLGKSQFFSDNSCEKCPRNCYKYFIVLSRRRATFAIRENAPAFNEPELVLELRAAAAQPSAARQLSVDVQLHPKEGENTCRRYLGILLVSVLFIWVSFRRLIS